MRGGVEMTGRVIHGMHGTLIYDSLTDAVLERVQP